MFAFQDKRRAVEVAFTDRFGGSSAAPYAELNLSARGDDPASPGNQREVLRAMVGPAVAAPVGLIGMRQVHGARVVVVTEEPGDPGGHPEAQNPEVQNPEADALVTARAGWVLLARGADCIPVLLADPDRGVVGAVHAGRAGLVTGVVPKAVIAMAELGAGPLTAWLGPRACGRCYEVPAALRDEVAAQVPAAWSTTSWGTPALDLAAGVTAQLSAHTAEIVDVARCTIEDPDLYSFRRQGGAAGRHGGLIWMRP